MLQPDPYNILFIYLFIFSIPRLSRITEEHSNIVKMKQSFQSALTLELGGSNPLIHRLNTTSQTQR